MINNGDPVEASVVNSAFVSRVANTTVLSVLSLNAPASGALVSNLQGSINKIYDTIGTSENDNNSKNYGGAPILTSGSSYKQSLIDLANAAANNAAQIASLNTVVSSLQSTVTGLQNTVTILQNDIDAIKVQSFTFQGNKTFQNNVTINGQLTVQGVSTFNNDALFSQNVTIQGLLSYAQKLTINNLVTQTQATFNGNITSYATASFEAPVTITGPSASLTVNRPASFNHTVTISGTSSSLTVNCDSTFSGNISQGASNNASFGNLSSKNKQLVLNDGGSSSGQNDAGLLLKGPSSADDGFFKTDATGEKWILKAPNKAGVIEFNLPASGVVTLPSGSGPSPSASDFYIVPEERTLGEAINAGVFVMRYGGDYTGESRKKLYKLPFASQINNASLVLVFVTTAKAAGDVLDESECCLIGTVTLPSSIFSASDKLLWIDTSNGSLITTPPSSIVIEAGWVLDANKMIFKPTFICY